MYNSNSFSKEDLKKALSKNSAIAEKIVDNPTKLNEFINKAIAWLKKRKEVPGLGKVISDIEAMISMLNDYHHKRYNEVPKATIILTIAVLIYVFSPIDLIPDYLPVVGFLDDAAIIFLAMDLGMGIDLNKYKKWKQNENRNSQNEVALEISKSIDNYINHSEVVGAFVLEDDSIRILVNSEQQDNPPYVCYGYIYNIDNSIFDHLDLYSENDKITFIKNIFSQETIIVNPACTDRIVYEHNCQDYNEFYIITDKE